MMSRLLAIGALLLILGDAAAQAETIAGLPLHIHRYPSGAIRVWVGDHVSSTAVVAIPTSGGIVVIDTTGELPVDRELRRVIARELGRDDFVMLVNTHEHGDHTGGNEVYADCEIVGHALVAEAMARRQGQEQVAIDWATRRMAELDAQIAQLAADAPEGPRLREELMVVQMHLAEARTPARSVPPTRTFSDRLQIAVGDTEFEFYYIGGMHSASDIAVLVPAHGLLMTGDTMADVWLTETPGCLGAFAAHPGVRHDFPLQIENWHRLLARKDEVRTLVPGHWNGELSWAGFEARTRYIESLWTGVQAAVAAGGTLADVRTQYRFATRYPELVDSPGCTPILHDGTIREMWAVVTGQRSASDALNAAMEDEAEFAAVVAQARAKAPEFYYDEPSLNGMGYWMLEIGQVDRALAVFRLVVDLFPDSWNAHDSLGEALLRSGDREGAIASYERSLVLNPENTNGRQVLERIASGAANPEPPRPARS